MSSRGHGGHGIRVAAKRSTRLIKEVRLRDGEICQCCGSCYGIEVHHIESVAFGGQDVASNCVCLCSECHDNVPSSPDQFLAYQRKGGALGATLAWILKSQGKHNDAAVLSSLDWNYRLEIIDQIRQRWGWTTGSNAVLADDPAEQLSIKETVQTLEERLHRVWLTVSWFATLKGESQPRFPYVMNEQKALMMGEWLPSHFSAEHLFRAAKENAIRVITSKTQILLQAIDRQAENHHFDLSHLTVEVERAEEDLYVAIARRGAMGEHS